MPGKPKVIYIAGAGRSGSTFLSLLVSQHPQIGNLGQIRDVFLAGSRAARCSCGALLQDCSVWGEVVSGAEGETRRLGKLTEDRVAQIYQSAFGALGVDVAVDSSKSADLCRRLFRSPHIDLYCLNLIRDPRAVAVSWSKVLHSPEVLRKRCQNWADRQRRIEDLFQDRPDRLMQLTYEDLVRDPFAAIAAIQAWVGVPLDLNAFSGAHAAHISWEEQHLFAPANEAVLLARATFIRIAEARAWTAPAAKPVREMATEMCFPFAKRYGYRIDTIAKPLQRSANPLKF